MSSARQGLSIVGQIAGAFIGGPVGAAVGGIIGGEVGGLIDGPPEGPRLDDLSAPQVQYGGKIGRLYGGPKWFDCGYLWASEKRESSETVGGKGGDSGQEQFSYHSDILYRVCESREGTPCEVIAVTGVEIDGQLVWTALADAPLASITASASQENWSEMTVLLGAETQAPWSVYETAVGATNANAYRGYLTVGFSDMLLGNGGAPRRVRIQAITAGTPDATGVLVRLQAQFAIDASDESYYDETPTLTGSATYGGAFNIPNGDTTIEATWAGSQFAQDGATPWTLQADSTLTSGLTLSGSNNLVAEFAYLTAVGSRSYRIEYNYSAFDGPHVCANINGARVGIAALSLPATNRYAIRLSNDTVEFLINGVVVYSAAETMYASIGSESVKIGRRDDPDNIPREYSVDSLRLKWAVVPDVDLATPGTLPAPDMPIEIWTPGTVLLRDILEYEAERCAPLTAANIDFSSAAGLEVDCHVAIGSAAEAMQPLLTRFWFDLYSADKLTLVRRGGSVEQTIPFRWTGAGQGERSEPFSGLVRANDVEVAKKKAITYADLLKDGEADTRTGDRESVGANVETLNLNLHMIPSEAQGLADTATWDARVGAHSATVRIGARHGLLLQPGGVVNLVDHKDNIYRVLVPRIVWDRWAWECEVRLDDPNVLQAAGIATDVDRRALTVAEPPEATLYVLDIPLLRLQDDGPGEYVCITQTGRFRGVDILKSNDDVTYSVVAEVTTRGTAGSCDSALPAYAGWGWDNSSVLTVTLDDGSGSTLSSATKTAIEANRAFNLAAVGTHGRWELVQFATATLLTGTTYELRGILRNLFGTEWANDSHTAADSFVMLHANGMTRVPGAVSDLGQTRYYKAVPRGRSSANVTAESIICEEQALLPYAVADLRNDAGTVKWNRRSRIEGVIGNDPPLGEVSERYDAELYTGMTLDDSETVTSPEWLPGVSPDGRTARVYQLSDVIGPGHVAEKAL